MVLDPFPVISLARDGEYDQRCQLEKSDLSTGPVMTETGPVS
jgi:hypothetical protein